HDDEEQQGQQDVPGGQLQPEGGDDAHAPGPGERPRPGEVRRRHVGVEAVDGGEDVAAVPEGLDDAGQGGHGLGAVTAAVVEEDDRAGRSAGHDLVDDGVDAGAAPVAGI